MWCACLCLALKQKHREIPRGPAGMFVTEKNTKKLVKTVVTCSECSMCVHVYCHITEENNAKKNS